MITRSMRYAALLVAGLGLSACANQTQERTAIGAAGGGLLGAGIGSFSGNAGLGALIGAGAGGLGGYLYDQSVQSHENNAYRQGYRQGSRGRRY
jgi:uncharacterized membrane protein